MERLTKKGFNFTTDFIKRDIDSWSIAQCLKKLQEYEDAEEQGLLLRLPCRVGDTVFKLKKHNYCPVGICRKDISCSECRANTPFGIAEGKFMLKELKEIGRTVFLTQSEAEQKLKEMESDWYDDW